MLEGRRPERSVKLRPGGDRGPSDPQPADGYGGRPPESKTTWSLRTAGFFCIPEKFFSASLTTSESGFGIKRPKTQTNLKIPQKIDG